jgi:hypothetical protein
MKIRTLGAVGVLALALTACGGGDDEKASESISKAIRDSDSQNMTLTQQQADCIGEGFVEEIGTDQLVEYKVLKEDLSVNEGVDNAKMSEGDAEAAADVVLECADVREVFTGMMEGMPEEAQTCLEEQLTDERLRAFLAATFSGNQDDEAVQELSAAMQECVTAGLGGG